MVGHDGPFCFVETFAKKIHHDGPGDCHHFAFEKNCSQDMEYPQLIIRTPNESRRVHAFGDTMILHLGTDDTGGRFSMWTEITPPGGGPPLHYHENEDEWFWPISNSAEFLIDNQWISVPPKTAVFAPRRSVHTFRNPNSEPLEMLIQTIPGGFDKFFSECAEEFSQNSPPNMDSIVEISARYGIYFVDQPTTA